VPTCAEQRLGASERRIWCTAQCAAPHTCMLDSWLCSVLRGAPYTCSTVWTGAGPAAARQHARLSVSVHRRRPPLCALVHVGTVPCTRLATGRSCVQARFRRAPAALPAPPRGLQPRTETGSESQTLRLRRNASNCAAACHAGERPGRARRAAPACAMGGRGSATHTHAKGAASREQVYRQVERLRTHAAHRARAGGTSDFSSQLRASE
jgi:hypothetical protein